VWCTPQVAPSNGLRRASRGAGAAVAATARHADARTRAAPDPRASSGAENRTLGMAAAASIPSTGDGSQAATPTRHYHGLGAAFALPPKPLHLAVGMFDGVHLGHRAVIESAVLSAQRTEEISAALTFQPHPSRALTPE